MEVDVTLLAEIASQVASATKIVRFFNLEGPTHTVLTTVFHLNLGCTFAYSLIFLLLRDCGCGTIARCACAFTGSYFAYPRKDESTRIKLVTRQTVQPTQTVTDVDTDVKRS